MRLPFLPPIDPFSFWLGFGLAVLAGLILFRYRQPLARASEAAAGRVRGLREIFTAGTERNLRKDVRQWAQTSHLAGGLFALDDLLIPPRLLLPEPGLDPTLPPAEDADPTSIIPVIPDWLDLAATYRAPTLSATEALSGKASLLVLGQPGSGKSTLLAHLASLAAVAGEDDPVFGGATPLLVHAADLELPGSGDVLQPLIAAAQARASLIITAQLPRHLHARLTRSKCLIFLDGFDELPPSQIADSAAWLAAFQKEYPQHRVVAASGLWGHGPLLALGLAPVLLAPWGADDYRALIQKWGEAWQTRILARRPRSAPPEVDPHIVMGWLGSGNAGRTVFEVTLKVWAAFAGDARGSRPVDWLESHILRAGVTPAGQHALGKLAVAMLNQKSALGLPRQEAVALLDPLFTGPDGKPQLDSDDFIDGLVSRRVLARHRDRISFRHSLAAAYCAATALAHDPAGINPGTTPAWVRALYFFAALGDLTPIVGQRLGQAADVVQTDLFAAARWLRDAPAAARWRSDVFRRLSVLLLNAEQPESLRLRALTAFVAASDPAIAALFKQAVSHPDPFTRRLATLGLGALGDPALTAQLTPLFADPYLDVRWAAALALAVTGSEAAVDALVHGLAQGDDELRRACAQALARQLESGHDLLKEAIAHEDLAVRRAAVYGLADTRTEWARKKLDEMQHTEQEWFVRSAVTEVLDQMNEPAEKRAPQAYVQPESAGWLIAWAATKGTGVPPGKAAIQVLGRALHEGDGPVRLAAAQAIGRLCDPALARDLYGPLRDSDPLLRDAAYRALAEVSAAAAHRLAAA